jgi:uncharacterized FlgJ-related protein
MRIHVVWFIVALLVVVFFINVYSDNKKENTIIEKEDSVSVQWRQNHFLLSEENLYNELVAQGVDFPEIVTAQALLETGHFKSYACLQQNNLFGLRDSKGKYMSFPHWTDAVAAYKKYIQRYNHPVPEDYYAYLQELGYAEDPQYIDKLKQIVNK